ncbi:hypothetical protein ACPCXD_20215 [Rhodococcus sp. AB351]|uniref:hypothetical protein n=1 Tax=Rhodococcus sp. AB351 TaxID=3413280 RepID=UPI003C138251
MQGHQLHVVVLQLGELAQREPRQEAVERLAERLFEGLLAREVEPCEELVPVAMLFVSQGRLTDEDGERQCGVLGDDVLGGFAHTQHLGGLATVHVLSTPDLVLIEVDLDYERRLLQSPRDLELLVGQPLLSERRPTQENSSHTSPPTPSHTKPTDLTKRSCNKCFVRKR